MKIAPYTGDIHAGLMSLLLTADPDEMTVMTYLSQSQILVASDGGTLVGTAVIVLDASESELKNIAVAQAYQGRGIAKRLIAEARQLAKQSGAVRMKVGTGNSSLSQIALYQKCGFRMHSVIPDFFLAYPEPIYENGIRCLDMIVLEATL